MQTPSDRRRIVSSRHLAEGAGWEVSEFEYGLIIAYNAFSRWMQRCKALVPASESYSAIRLAVITIKASARFGI